VGVQLGFFRSLSLELFRLRIVVRDIWFEFETVSVAMVRSSLMLYANGIQLLVVLVQAERGFTIHRHRQKIHVLTIM
jgi:hypothetical protein